MKPVQLSTFLGENNRLPAQRLATKDGAFVRHAVNVDVTDAGTLQRRQGVEKVVSGADCHSFWSNGKVGYYMDGGTLFMVDDAMVKRTVLTGLPSGMTMSYCAVNGEVYCSNGQSIWRLNREVAVLSGIEPPNRQPTLTVLNGGSMPAGVYQVAVSFLAPDGEESGATLPVSAHVGEGGLLAIGNIQVAPGYSTAVYVSTPGGNILFRHKVTTDSSLVITTPSVDQGVQCRSILMTRMPPGQIVRYLNGRLLVASGNFLHYSEPHALGLYNPQRNFIPFPEPVTMIEPCQNGFYISAEQTCWVDGNLPEADLNPVLPYRAVIGTSGQVPNSNNVFWMSERGMVVGTQNGEVSNMQEDKVAVDPALVGASLFREQDGMKQMVASLFSPQQTVMAARSYMDAEVIRKETSL